MAQKKKVLVIDDDAAVCKLIEQTLERHGLEVMTTRDARSGFETSRTLFPDLIFINLLLPEINGLKVSKAIHSVEALKTVPVIMVVSHPGELEPKYTKTIGIVDVLVKPFNADEVIAKTKAVLGGDAFGSATEELSAMPLDEEEPEPAIVLDMDEEEDAAVLAFAEGDREGPQIAEEHENSRVADTAGASEAEGYAGLSGRIRRGQNEDGLEEQDLFSAIPGASGEQTTTVRDESVHAPGTRGMTDESMDDYDPEAGEPPVSPVRRVLIIAASIVAGIALGIGGYLFFTAGTKQASTRKQVAKVLPGPAAVAPSAPASPAEKPNIIPEIPVKQEPLEPKTAQQKESKNKEQAPAEARSSGKKEDSQKQPEKKVVPKPSADTAYYVQAGVFENRDNAAALAARIKEAGFDASVQKVDNAGKKTLYRVIAGSSVSHEKAVEMSASLSRKGIKTIVRRQ